MGRTLGVGEQRRLRTCISKRVFELTKRTTVSNDLFKEIHRDLKAHFKVSSYKNIEQRFILQAINYIEHWKP